MPPIKNTINSMILILDFRRNLYKEKTGCGIMNESAEGGLVNERKSKTGKKG